MSLRLCNNFRWNEDQILHIRGIPAGFNLRHVDIVIELKTNIVNGGERMARRRSMSRYLYRLHFRNVLAIRFVVNYISQSIAVPTTFINRLYFITIGSLYTLENV